MGLYDDRKAVALGLALPAEEPVSGGGMFDVQPSFGMRTEVHNQYFEKKVEALPAQKRYKIGLEFTDEKAFNKERKTAEKNLESLNQYLANGQADKIKQLLAKNFAAEWLSYVFLEKEDVDKLFDKIGKTTPECRKAITNAIEKELERLVAFQDLFELILEKKDKND